MPAPRRYLSPNGGGASIGERSGGVSPSSSSTCQGEGAKHCEREAHQPEKGVAVLVEHLPNEASRVLLHGPYSREGDSRKQRSSTQAIFARGICTQARPRASNGRPWWRIGACRAAEGRRCTCMVHVHVHTFELAPCRRAMARCCAFAAGLIGAFRSISTPPIPPPPPPPPLPPLPPSPSPSTPSPPPPPPTLTLLSMLPPRTRRAVSGCSSSRRAFSSTHLREYDDGWSGEYDDAWSEVGRHMRRSQSAVAGWGMPNARRPSSQCREQPGAARFSQRSHRSPESGLARHASDGAARTRATPRCARGRGSRGTAAGARRVRRRRPSRSPAGRGATRTR